jgi:hypothetical protein
MLNCHKIFTKFRINKCTGFKVYMKSWLGGIPRIFSLKYVHEFGYRGGTLEGTVNSKSRLGSIRGEYRNFYNACTQYTLRHRETRPLS